MSGLVSVVFVYKPSLKRAGQLSDCAVEQQNGVVCFVCVCVCVYNNNNNNNNNLFIIPEIHQSVYKTFQ